MEQTGDILGYVTSTVDLSQLPREDGQANFPVVQDKPYAPWPEDDGSQALAVLMNGKWVKFVFHRQAEPKE